MGHLAFDRTKNVRLSNLFVRVARQVGVEIDSFWHERWRHLGNLTDEAARPPRSAGLLTFCDKSERMLIAAI